MAAINRNNSKGVTLIEMLIALAILSILITAAVVGFGKTGSRKAANALADELVTSIALARTEATRMQKPVSLILCTAGSKFSNGWKIVEGSNCNDIIREILPPSAGSVNTAHNPMLNRITIRPDGTADTSLLTEVRICVTDVKEGYIVSINSMGVPHKKDQIFTNTTTCATD